MFSTIAGLRTRYICLGEGEPILLLHGWGTQIESLSPLTTHLTRYRKVYVLDFPGFGASQLPPADWTVGNYTEWIYQFIAKFNLEKIALLGHSFGGRVAIKFAAAWPEAVDRLVLVDSAGVRQYETTPRFQFYRLVAKLGRPVLSSLPPGMRKRAQWRLYKAIGSTDYLTAGSMKGTYSKVISEDLEPFLPLIRARTLLIWGEQDQATPVTDARVMAQKIPDNQLVVIPKAGHYPFLDQPQQVFQALDAFLSPPDRSS